MANSNVLEGWKCPGCGSEGPFFVDATIRARVLLYDDGAMEEDPTETTWEPENFASCLECGLEAQVRDFTREQSTFEASPVTVNNEIELFESISGETLTRDQARDRLKKAIYKGTDCGAWLDFSDTSVKVGSIVEGTDAETNVYELQYPFTLADFWQAAQAVEDEADEIWNDLYADDEEEDE